jgi:hypothetical protein
LIAGTKDSDFEVKTAKEINECRNMCFMDKNCNAYEFSGTDCNLWKDGVDQATGLKVNVDPPKGNGGAGACYIKDSSSMTEVEYMANNDEDGMVPALPG